jgi:hypothetical protein
VAQAHQRGIELFAQGRHNEAMGCFEEGLHQAETSEVWNDWVTAQFASGRVQCIQLSVDAARPETYRVVRRRAEVFGVLLWKNFSSPRRPHPCGVQIVAPPPPPHAPK